MANLVDHFQEYSTWRYALSRAVLRYNQWLRTSNFSDAQTEQQINHILERLSDDKLSIAFVAEFSRGKSELINAIFFADYGKRILPSSAGRTTMCPTELMYDANLPPSIRLLPIQTRAFPHTTTEYKKMPHEWMQTSLDTRSGDGMLEALKKVCETIRVPVDEAAMYGLFDDNDPAAQSHIDHMGLVEVSKWRHAIINFPHPLLEQGLVILDTPGLNAIGTEPELTLNLIPNAHAVLFVLAADTGVTKSDVEVWRNNIRNDHSTGRLIVLNKIDSMWDELKTHEQIEQEIARQASSCAQILDVPNSKVFPVSAQKGLVGKVTHDAKVLERSRLLELEKALSDGLIPAKQEIVREQMRSDVNHLVELTRTTIEIRFRGFTEQLQELRGLRGKNKNVIEHMMNRVQAEKTDFEKSAARMQAIRSVYTRLSSEIFATVGLDALKENIRATRTIMKNSVLSGGLRDAMDAFFIQLRENFIRCGVVAQEILDMMNAMYHQFSVEHGLALGKPITFAPEKYIKELDRLEAIYRTQFGSLAMLTNFKEGLTRRFFEAIAARTREIVQVANRDIDNWLKAIMVPIEAQVREYQGQLKRRLESIKKIHEATDTLEARITELEEQRDIQAAHLQKINMLHLDVSKVIEASLNEDFELSMA
jgi:Dynamin family